MMRYKVKKTKRPIRTNPVAKELQSDEFRGRVVPARKIYDRNKLERLTPLLEELYEEESYDED